jgi:hypothetical protein
MGGVERRTRVDLDGGAQPNPLPSTCRRSCDGKTEGSSRSTCSTVRNYTNGSPSDRFRCSRGHASGDENDAQPRRGPKPRSRAVFQTAAGRPRRTCGSTPFGVGEGSSGSRAAATSRVASGAGSTAHDGKPHRHSSELCRATLRPGQRSGRIPWARRVGYATPQRTTKRAAQRPRTANGRASPSAAGSKESRAPRVSRSRTPISQSGVAMPTSSPTSWPRTP